MPEPVPFFPPPGPSADTDDLACDLIHDLAELRQADRRRTVTRTAFAAGFVLIGAALAAPVVAQVPPRQLGTALVAALAVAAVVGLCGDAWHSLTRCYELIRGDGPGARRRIVRRWYAPGSTVWRADPKPWHGPLAVLGWVADPACRVPWALVYDGTPSTCGGAALWLPLDELAPHPTSPRPVPGFEVVV
ncbi:hypothetical protein BJY14_008016 [Actinomadura luteofluorescens]|uniref:Uncharacterized protein n=1 Tax=Actinomadura luteofluorescens TaxID=46163 RepID=A0A7Y9EQD3_9ACTN|nr:hypothetical protein [Actinomadura luteofluorescens]NYD52033.1 hypothetical protein [Actinomadura luteofluorescens]